MILAIDPGTSKVGWAIVDDRGMPVDQGILIIDMEAGRLGQLAGLKAVRTVVLGNGTNRMNIEAECKRLLPQAEVVVIDEKGSTVDAWKLKRSEEAGRDPLRGLWFTLVQLFAPSPVDDYAARILAERYLAQKPGDGA